MRLDLALVQREIVQKRSQGQVAINEGLVEVNGRIVTKPSYKTSLDDDIRLTSAQAPVGRGALKIAPFFDEFKISLEGLNIADFGASTGGFTQAALERGAHNIVAIDVGVGQLAQKLRDNPRVIVMEETHVNELQTLPIECSLGLVDLSFISLKKVLPSLARLMKGKGELIALYKPQFEIGPEGLGKRGKAPLSLTKKAFEDFFSFCKDEGHSIFNLRPCALQGRKSGNQEYFLRIRLGEGKDSAPLAELLAKM